MRKFTVMTYPHCRRVARVVSLALLVFVALTAAGCSQSDAPRDGQRSGDLPAAASDAQDAASADATAPIDGTAAADTEPGKAVAYDGPPRADTKWRLEASQTIDRVGEVEITLAFGSDNSVSGFTGCNRFRGNYTLDAQQISFGPLMTSKRACLGPASETEQQFLQAIGQVESAREASGKLVLTLKDGAGELRFIPE